METVHPEEVGLSTTALRRLDEHLLRRYIEPGKIAGALTVVARHGKIAHASPLGFMDRERRRPMREDTIFRIYSMTKPIASVALMMLYEEGAFQLSDPVHRFIPAWEDLCVYRLGRHPNFVTEPPVRPMTVRDLLTHQSGLTYGFMDRTNVDAAYRSLRIGDGSGTLKDMVDALATLPLEFSPGTRWNYSVATDVVGYLVEVLSGQAFDRFLADRIFGPLGMRDTAFHVPDEKASRLAASYTRTKDGSLALLDDPEKSPFRRPRTFFSGGSGLVSTAADYLRFMEALRRGGELSGVRLLGSRTLRYMTTNHLPRGGDLASLALGSFAETRYEGVGFGLGFSVLLDPVRAQIPSSAGEFGWGGMASTAFWLDPEADLSVLFLTQLVPSSTYNFRSELRAIVCGALLD